MNDYSEIYTTNKDSEIIIARNNVMIKFKPFLESFSVDVKENFIEVKSVYVTSLLGLGGTKERKYKITFNVPAANVNEGIENHKKFQKLLRMSLPNETTADNSFFIKFANLIKRDSENSNTSLDYNNFTINVGVQCKISNLNYSPEMDLGFFDDNSMFFAKNYKIDLDLEIYPASYPRKKHYSAEQLKGNQDSLIKPGNLFGFEINYKKEKQQ